MQDQKKSSKAVALQYDSSQSGAPKVIASGQGEIAAAILEKAREAGVHIVENPDLVEILARIPLDEEIPEELYQAVAEILSFVYRVNGRYSASSA